jgi:hypothetical protein
MGKNSLGFLQDSLTLRELESLSSLPLSVLLPLNHSSIASQQTVEPKRGSVLFSKPAQSPGNPKFHCAGLTGWTTTLDIRHYVVFSEGVCHFQRLKDI